MPWYDRPLETRAPAGGGEGVNDDAYRGGEFMPFYVPRPEMPQLESAEAFAQWCQGAMGLPVQFLPEVDPADLHPHQRVDLIRARHIQPQHMDLPVVVAAEDRFIVDGNHRWFEHRELGLKVKAWMISGDFESVVALAFKYLEQFSPPQTGA